MGFERRLRFLAVCRVLEREPVLQEACRNAHRNEQAGYDYGQLSTGSLTDLSSNYC